MMAVESAVWQNGVKGPMGVEGYHMWFIAFSLLIKPSGCCLNNGVITEETTPKINVSEQLCNNCFMVYGIFSCDEVTVRIYFIFSSSLLSLRPVTRWVYCASVRWCWMKMALVWTRRNSFKRSQKMLFWWLCRRNRSGAHILYVVLISH